MSRQSTQLSSMTNYNHVNISLLVQSIYFDELLTHIIYQSPRFVDVNLDVAWGSKGIRLLSIWLLIQSCEIKSDMSKLV